VLNSGRLMPYSTTLYYDGNTFQGQNTLAHYENL
jgi:hypothetical protein